MLNKDALKKIMDRLDSSNRKKSNIWKPPTNEDGSICESRIRVLPYRFADDGIPFREVHFYYEIGALAKESSLVAPYQTYGEPDPILDFLNDLRASSRNDKDIFALWKKYQPKVRYYAPVLVRWEKTSANSMEDKGVQWWGFSPTVFKDFLQTILNEDYADVDITDPAAGLDFTIITSKTAGKSYYDTKLTPARKESFLVTNEAKKFDKDAAAELVASVDDIRNVFPPKSKDELEEILKRFHDAVRAANSDASDEESDDDAVVDAGTSRVASKASVNVPETVSSDDDDEDSSSDITARLREKLRSR